MPGTKTMTTITLSAESVLELRKALRAAGIEPTTKGAGGLELGPYVFLPMERDVVALEAASVLTVEDRGLVEVLANGRTVTQMTPSKAQDLALGLLRASESAIADQVFVTYAANELGLDRDKRTRILAELRPLRHSTRAAILG